MTVSLSELVKAKMKKDNLSLRKAGTQSGVAHTTIDRLLKGEQLDLATVEKIGAWLNIPVSKVLDIETDAGAQRSEFPGLIALHPELGDVMTELATEITKNNMDQAILAEITGFASYRMQMYREKSKREQENQ